MRKILLLLAMLLATNIQIARADDKPVILHPRKKETNSEHGNKPRSPIAIPEVFIDGYTLTFDASCIGCSVDIIDEDGEIVYTDIVDENGIVELPTNLTGTYELQFTRGGITFVGEIEL